jgi:hypothetical protein
MVPVCQGLGSLVHYSGRNLTDGNASVTMNRDVDPALRWNDVREQAGQASQQFEPAGQQSEEAGFAERDRAAEARPDPSRMPGRIALALSLLLLALDVVALVLADNRAWVAATVLAQVATVGTIVAFVVGAGAVIVSRGRRWGIAAVVLAVVANPIILTKVLGFLAG